MTDSMEPKFANGLRQVLIAQVDGAPSRRRHVRWRWGIGAVMVAGLLGGGAAVAAQVLVQPGADEHASLTAPVAVSKVGTATITLGPRPAHATEAYLTFEPIDPGAYAFGRGGAGVKVESGSPVNGATTYYLRPSELDPGRTSLTITTSSPTMRWSATLTWVSAHTTAWGVNAAGQSYGVQNDNGTPDLIAVVATNGKQGYVFRKALEDADGTTAAKSFTSPQQALDWQKAHGREVAHVPVYRSDGKTKIGVFTVGP